MGQFDGFDAFVTDLMTDWDVPGVAIAVVKDQEVVYQQGYGLRDKEQGLPVDVNTIFAIGSSSKAFTALALGILVDEGKLDWYAPVRDYMPDFQLYDPTATAQMSTIDLLSHRSGLPRHDLLWYGTSLSRADLFKKLRHLQPTKDFRSFMQYQNLMYMTAGYLIERITGQTWEDFVQQRIFDPLGMTRSNTSVDVTQQQENIALPYTRPELDENPELRRVPFRNIDAVGPAGSINSSVADMVQWVRLNLEGGAVGETRIVSEEVIKQQHQRHMPIIREAMMFKQLDEHPDVGQASYGLGWFVQQYRGTRWVHHGGSIDGFNCFVSLLPDKNIGVVAIGNRSGSLPVIMCAAANVHDRLLGLEPLDWNAIFHEYHEQQIDEIRQGTQKLLDSQKPNAPATHPLAAYSGTYTHVAYGPITVGTNGDTLSVKYNDTAFDEVRHLHYNVFLLKNATLPTYLPVNFAIGSDGEISSVSVPLEPSLPPAVFTREKSAAEGDATPAAEESTAPA